MSTNVSPRCAPILITLLFACSAEPRGEPAPSFGLSDAATFCQPNAIVECACADRAGTRRCKISGEDFFPCFCGGDDVGPIPIIDPPDAGLAADANAADAEADAATGIPPTVGIQHPSDGEMRAVNSMIPFDGSAVDVEDGILQGSALTWSSDRDGNLGTGASIRAPLTTFGRHVIALTAIDSDGNAGAATITLELVP